MSPTPVVRWSAFWILVIFGIVQALRCEQSFSLLSSPPRTFRYSFILRIFLFVFFLLFSYSLPHLCLLFVLLTVTRSVVPSQFISLQFPPFSTVYTCCVSAMFPVCILAFREACLVCVHASDLCWALCYPWIPRSEHVSVHLHCVWNMIWYIC